LRRVLIRYGELFVTLAIFLTSLFLLLTINNYIKVSSSRVAADQLGPKFWPILILIGIVFLTGIILFKIFRQIKNKGWDSEQEDATIDQFTDKRLFTLISITVIYVFLLPYLGFLSLTPFFIIFVSWLIGIRVIWKNLTFSILLTAIFIYVFGNFLYVPLPRGIGFIRELSFIFY
jgi:putative tricarboxylic transport membrane protein